MLSQLGTQLQYQVDLTSLPTQSFSGNGAVTIDNNVWTVENFAAATSFGLVKGSGLVFGVASGAGSYSGGSRSALMISTGIAQLIKNFNFLRHRYLRIWTRILLTSADANFKYFKVGLEHSNSGQNHHMVGQKGFDNPSLVVQTQVTNTATSISDTATPSGDDVLVCTYETPLNTMDFHTGQFRPEGFPPVEELTLRSSWNISNNVTTANTTFSPGNMRLIMVGQPTGAASSFTATVTHLKLETVNFLY